MAYGDLKRKISEQSEPKDESSLRCSAHGCTLRWSVDGGESSKLCSYHAWEPASKWPKITDDLKQFGAWRLGETREVDITSHNGHPKAWAMRLKERHMAGEKLSKFQEECYKSALKENLVG
jgi:hypothetical protein